MKHTRKYFAGSTVLALIVVVLLLSTKTAFAVTKCDGQGCYQLDPQTTYSSDGAHICSADTTVAYYPGIYPSGTNGTLWLQLRYSGYCHSNWARGYVHANNANTKQIGLKAMATNVGYWTSVYYQGNPLPASDYVPYWTNMVNGWYLAWAVGGLNGSYCSGSGGSGFPCNYNPTAAYSG
ncbi:MAG: hypothetical protein WBM17_06210 [Anaerolineales bacterium]